jgi:hypothetical protein
MRTAFALLLCAVPAAATATPILTGLATVTFSEPGYTDETEIVTIGPGREIVFGPTGIGNSILLDGEYIDIGQHTITLRLFGGGDEIGTSNYLELGFDPDATYHFTSLLFDVPGYITGVTAVTSQISNFIPASDLSFTGNSVSVRIGGLGIATEELNNPGNLGLLTLTVQTQALDATAVPEPASLSLLGLGLAAAWRKRSRQSKGKAQ